METGESVEELKKIFIPALEEENIELIELNFFRRHGSVSLRLLVDRREGGISIGDCARLNSKLGNILDARNLIEERYVLEVSSPGLDRPLKEKSDFLRCLNKEVKVFLKEPINGKIEFDGIVVQAQEESVVIDSSGEILEIPLVNITKGKLVLK